MKHFYRKLLDYGAADARLFDHAVAVEFVHDLLCFILVTDGDDEASRMRTNGLIFTRRDVDPLQAVACATLANERQHRLGAGRVPNDRLVAGAEDGLVLGPALLA